MNTATRILEALSTTATSTLGQLYDRVSTYPHVVRGRLHDLVRRGQAQRVGRGLYIRIDSSTAQVGVQADSRIALADLAARGARFDAVILDLPYTSEGVRGGNRDLAAFASITPAEFGAICDQVVRLVGQDTPVVFIFSNGKSSAKARKAYEAEIAARFTAAAQGTYTKVAANGKPCQFMGRLMPGEDLVIYTKSGRVNAEALDLDITEVRPTGYKTEKPIGLLTRMFSQLAKAGQWILDPFGGSGSTSEACRVLGMNSLSIDIAHNPVEYWAARQIA